jgi:hypothetical protein
MGLLPIKPAEVLFSYTGPDKPRSRLVPRLVEQHLRAARESKLGKLEIRAVTIRRWQSTAIRHLDDEYEIWCEDAVCTTC